MPNSIGPRTPILTQMKHEMKPKEPSSSMKNQKSKSKNMKTLLICLGLALLAVLALTLDHAMWYHCTGALGLALAVAPIVLTDEQVKEFQSLLGEMKGGWAELKPLPASFKALQDESLQLQQNVNEMRRTLAARASFSPRMRARGQVSDECAR